MTTLVAPVTSSAGRLMRLALDDLHIDRTYQRPANERRVAQIVATFNPHALTALHVSQRSTDGLFYVVDGQHRLAALRRLGHVDAPCYVENMTQADEATAFSKIQTGRASLRAADLYRADLASGDALAMAIRHELRVRGLEVSTKLGVGFSAIATVRKIAERRGLAHLANTLDVIGEAWGHQPRNKAYNAIVVEAVARFLAAYPAGVNRNRLIAQGMASGPDAILVDRHRHPGSPPVAAALALVTRHNKGGRRGAIDMTTAYAQLAGALDPRKAA